MALPHQVPLYRALDAVESRDFEAAEEAVVQFFNALENDPIAKDCRRQHFDRQVFEADFLSILIKEEIGAWGIIASIKLSRDDVEGARNACFRMIELIDQYYGFDTPSWNSPEARIPINPELMSRYFQIASLLTEIYEQQNDEEMSKRWANVRRTAVSDIQQPEIVWGRWISEDEASGGVGITIYEFSDWQIEKRTADGRDWLANIYRSLTERISPNEMNWLVKIRIPTDEQSDVPTKAMRWKIWTLRLAITSRFHKAKVGAYFGELQTRGERVLLYYATGENEARMALGHILEDASELHPILEIKHDLGWKEYSKWGDSSIIVSSPLAVQMPEPLSDESENDRALRKLWSACESIHSTISRLSLLAKGLSSLPPADEKLKRFCIDYLFALAVMTESNNGYYDIAIQLTQLDAESAIKAFDNFFDAHCVVDVENQAALSVVAEAIAAVSPTKAMQVEKVLRKSGYSLVHSSSAKIAANLCKNDRAMAMEVVQVARRGIIDGEGHEFDKASFLAEIAREVSDFFPEFAKEMLIESEAYVQEISSCDVKAQAYFKVLDLAEVLYPEKLPEFCNRAIENALKLESDDAGYWGFGGMQAAIFAHIVLVRYVALFDATTSVELAAHAFEKIKEFYEGAIDRIFYLSNLAESIAKIDENVSRDLAEDIWSELKIAMESMTSNDSYHLNQRVDHSSFSPLTPFILMNPAVAADRLTTILSICRSASLPEREVSFLCTFASELKKSFPKAAQELIDLASELAPKCSSDHLRIESLMLVAATKQKCGLDFKFEYTKSLETLSQSFDVTGRFYLLLDFASMFDEKSTERRQLISEAYQLFASYGDQIEERDSMEKLKRFSPRECCDLFFLLLDKLSNVAQRATALHWFVYFSATDKDNKQKHYH